MDIQLHPLDGSPPVKTGYVNPAARLIIGLGTLLLPPVRRSSVPKSWVHAHWLSAVFDEAEEVGLFERDLDELVPFDDRRPLVTGYAWSLVWARLAEAWLYYWLAAVLGPLALLCMSKLTCMISRPSRRDPSFWGTKRASLYLINDLRMTVKLLIASSAVPYLRRRIYLLGGLSFLMFPAAYVASLLPTAAPFQGFGTEPERLYFTYFWSVLRHRLLLGEGQLDSVGATGAVLASLWVIMLIMSRGFTWAYGWLHLSSLIVGLCGCAAAVFTLGSILLVVVPFLIWLIAVLTLMYFAIRVLIAAMRNSAAPAQATG